LTKILHTVNDKTHNINKTIIHKGVCANICKVPNDGYSQHENTFLHYVWKRNHKRVNLKRDGEVGRRGAFTLNLAISWHLKD